MSASRSASVPAGNPNDTEHFRFVTPGRLEYRDAAKAFVAHVCDLLVQQRSFETDDAHQVISAFVEAFNNAVIHGGDGGAASIEVEMSIGPSALELSVIDQGKFFEADAVPEPDLDALPEGGMGLFIMRSFMDRVEYRREGERNILAMAKTLNPASQAE